MSKTIALVSVSGNQIEESANKLKEIVQTMPKNFFHEIILCTNRLPKDFSYKWIKTDINNRWDYEEYVTRQLAKVSDCDFILCVEPDSGIGDPDKWTDEFLEYDYIGAPWEGHMLLFPGNRVGNSGFCLRSRKWLERATTVKDRPPGPMNCDVWTQQYAYDHFKDLKTAPVSVAAKFAVEHVISECPARKKKDCFGWHGFFVS